jgi:hypothetical protein
MRSFTCNKIINSCFGSSGISNIFVVLRSYDREKGLMKQILFCLFYSFYFHFLIPNLEEMEYIINKAGSLIIMVTMAPKLPGGLEMIDF